MINWTSTAFFGLESRLQVSELKYLYLRGMNIQYQVSNTNAFHHDTVLSSLQGKACMAIMAIGVLASYVFCTISTISTFSI